MKANRAEAKNSIPMRDSSASETHGERREGDASNVADVHAGARRGGSDRSGSRGSGSPVARNRAAPGNVSGDPTPSAANEGTTRVAISPETSDDEGGMDEPEGSGDAANYDGYEAVEWDD